MSGGGKDGAEAGAEGRKLASRFDYKRASDQGDKLDAILVLSLTADDYSNRYGTLRSANVLSLDPSYAHLSSRTS